MPNLPVSEEQKRILENISHAGTEQLARRARLILAYADGLPTMQAAKQAGISRGRARYWKRQYISRGIDIFRFDAEDTNADENPTQVIETLETRDQVEPDTTQAESDQIEPLDEPAYPLVQPSVGIKPDDSLAVAGKKVWLYHFAVMLSHEEGTLLGEDAEELHDMRVATRRMRSAFDIFGEAFDPKLMKHYLNGLRSIGRALGQVRDMDVIIENGIDYRDKNLPKGDGGLEALIASWNQVLERKRKKLTKQLNSDNYLKFKQEFNKFLHNPIDDDPSGKQGIEATLRTRDIVPALIYSRYAKVRAFDSILPTASISQLHALRIEFKKFRYTLEYFKEILGESAGDAIDEIKRYQDHLGELHDADMACQLVGDFLKSWEENQERDLIAMRVNPEPIVTYIAYLHSMRYKLMSSFPKKWQYFYRPEFRQYLAQAISPL